MAFRTFDVAAIILYLIHSAYSEHILSCNVTSLEPCPGNNQMCDAKTLQCKCIPGFSMIDEVCEDDSTYLAPNHATTAALVTIFTLALVTCGLVLVVRKYNLVEHVRQRINMRRNNDVMYEDVMIGQDDPPLSP